MDYQTISNLLLPPKSIRMLVRENMRLIVFALLAAQIVVALSIDLFIRKKHSWRFPIPDVNRNIHFPKLFHGFRLNKLSYLDILSAIVFLLSVLIYSWLIIDNANLSFPDHSHITGEILSGNLWMQISPETGRFSPLVHQEYLLFSKFAKYAWQYYAISIIEMIVMCGIMISIIPIRSLSLRLLLTSSFVYSLGLAIPIAGLIYPEVNIIYALILFIFFALRLEVLRTQRICLKCIMSFFCMVVIVTYLIYLKEPFFLVFASYSLISIYADLKLNYLEPDSRSETTAAVKNAMFQLYRYSIEIGILFIAFVYAILYLLFIFVHIHKRYGSVNSGNLFQSLICSFEHAPILFVLFAYLAWRVVSVYRCFDLYKPIWDPLAFSFIFYYITLICLGMNSAYYYTPIVFVGLIYMLNVSSVQIQRRSLQYGIALFSLVIIAYELPDTIQHFRDRELFMQSRENAVDDIVKILKTNNHPTIPKIYFIERNINYDTTEFKAYLDYCLNIQYITNDLLTKSGLKKTNIALNVIPFPITNQSPCLLSDVIILNQTFCSAEPPRIGDILISLPTNAVAINISQHNSKMPLSLQLSNEDRPILSKSKQMIYSLFNKHPSASYVSYIYTFIDN